MFEGEHDTVEACQVDGGRNKARCTAKLRAPAEFHLVGHAPALLVDETDQLELLELMDHPVGRVLPSKDSCSKNARFCATLTVANSKANANSRVFFINEEILKLIILFSSAKIRTILNISPIRKIISTFCSKTSAATHIPKQAKNYV